MNKKLYLELFESNCFYDEAIFFTPYRYSDNYSIIKLSQKIYHEMLSVNPNIKKHAAKFKDHLKKILCDLAICFYQQKCLIISRDKKYYDTQLEDYKVMMYILDFMIDNEYIGQKLGCFDFEKKKGIKSRIWSKEKLLDLFEKENVKSSDIKNREKFNEILIRDEEKNDVDYEETEFIKNLRLRIGLINIEYAKHSIKMLDDFIFPRIQAIYSRRSIDLGGRLYAKPHRGLNYQTASKEVRKTITIDNEETIEVDYAGLHINMLYALEHIQYPLDKSPYSFWMDVQLDQSPNNLEIAKKQAKKAMFTLMNAKSIKDALWVLRDADSEVDWDNIIELMLKEHSRIKKYIGSDMGITLQNLDSKMMLDILEECKELEIVALGIHDSVIVQKKHKDEAVKIMKKIYEEHMKFNINVK